MALFSKVNHYIEKVLMGVGVALFTVFVFVVFAQVVARNIFSASIIWTQEVALFCFIWSVFLGGAIAIRQKKHYIVELFPERYKRVNAFLDVFAGLMVFLLIYVFVTAGYEFAIMGLRRTTQMGTLLIYYSSVFPVSGIFMFLFGLEVLIHDIKKAIDVFKRGDSSGSTHHAAG